MNTALQDEILASGADEAGGQTPSASAGQTPVATPPGHLSPDDEMGAPRLLDGELGKEMNVLVLIQLGKKLA